MVAPPVVTPLAVSLVKAGTVVTGTTSVALNFGQATAAGHLLVALVNNGATTTNITCNQPGWVNTATQGFWYDTWVWYKVAAGSDVAPTFSSSGATFMAGILVEFAGPTNSDQSVAGLSGGGGVALTLTCAAPDGAAGDLVVSSMYMGHGSAETTTQTASFNNGATATRLANNDSTSTINHYSFSYGVTTSNSVATSGTIADSGMKAGQATGKVQTFSLVPVDVGAVAMSGTSGMGLTGTLPINYLQDAFAQTGGVDTTKWTVSDTNVATVQGPGYPYVLQFTLPASSTAYHQLYSTYANYAYNYWNLTNNQISINCLSAGNQALTSLEVYPLYLTDETYNTGGKNAV